MNYYISFIYFLTSVLFAFFHRHGKDIEGKAKAPYYALILTFQFKRIKNDIENIWKISRELKPDWANLIHGLVLIAIFIVAIIRALS